MGLGVHLISWIHEPHNAANYDMIDNLIVTT
jgi:hypothetical protein